MHHAYTISKVHLIEIHGSSKKISGLVGCSVATTRRFALTLWCLERYHLDDVDDDDRDEKMNEDGDDHNENGDIDILRWSTRMGWGVQCTRYMAPQELWINTTIRDVESTSHLTRTSRGT